MQKLRGLEVLLVDFLKLTWKPDVKVVDILESICTYYVCKPTLVSLSEMNKLAY